MAPRDPSQPPTHSLTQQQEAEHPLQHGQELERRADITLRGPGHGQQCPQRSLDAGPAACGEGDTAPPKTARLERGWGHRDAGGSQGHRWEVGWEG